MVIVDELLLSLGVTGTDKVKAARSAVADFMGVFGRLLGMAGGAFALGKAIQGFVSDAVDLQRLSDITGESVENLSAWKQAIDAAGEDGSAFLGTVRGITENINNLLVSGSGDVRQYLNQLGVDIFDTNGQLKETTDILTDVAGAWDSYSSREQAMIGKHLGIDEGTIRFLQRGGEEVGSLLAKQKELGVITAAQAKAAKEVSTAYYQLQNIWRTTANALLAGLLPAIKWLIDGLNATSKWIISNKPVFYSILSIIGSLGALAAFYLTKMGFAWLKTAAISTLSSAKIAAAWLISIWPVALVVAALAAVGAALYLLYDDYMVWKEGGISAFGEVWEAWERIALAIGGGLIALGKFFKDFWNDPKKTWNESIAYLENRWRGMTLTEVGKDIIRSLSAGIKTAWDGYVAPFLWAIDNKFKQWFGFSLITEGNDLIMSLIAGITAQAAAIDSAIEQSVVGLIYRQLKALPGQAARALGEMIDAIFDVVVGNKSLFEAGKALIKAMWDGVNEMWTGFVNWLKGKLDSVLGILPDFVREKLGLNFDTSALAGGDVSPVAALPGGGAYNMNSSTSVGTMNVYTKSESPGSIRGAVGGALNDVNAQNQTAWTADGSTRR